MKASTTSNTLTSDGKTTLPMLTPWHGMEQQLYQLTKYASKIKQVHKLMLNCFDQLAAKLHFS